jgi:hypothetical protein
MESNTVGRRPGNPAWVAGRSGNPNGRPPGSRNRFSEAFVADVAASWQKQGVPFLDRLAVDDPSKYADVCSRLIPRDVALTVEQRLPGGMDERDLSILRAIRDAIPNANELEPQAVLDYTLKAIQSYGASPVIDAACELNTGSK